MAKKTGSDSPGSEKTPITIKKYANRRLYNTATSSYVTLDHLAQMVKDGTEFVVFDAKTGEEITRSVLTHIIVEEESKGQNLLPISFLRHLISFYGDNLQALVPRYLEQTMHSFAHNQEQMRQYMHETMNGLTPFGQFEEMGKKNLAMFDSAMRMFSPFQGEDAAKKGGAGNPRTDEPESQLEELRAQIKQMQNQLDSLTAKKPRT